MRVDVVVCRRFAVVQVVVVIGWCCGLFLDSTASSRFCFLTAQGIGFNRRRGCNGGSESSVELHNVVGVVHVLIPAASLLFFFGGWLEEHCVPSRAGVVCRSKVVSWQSWRVQGVAARTTTRSTSEETNIRSGRTTSTTAMNTTSCSSSMPLYRPDCHSAAGQHCKGTVRIAKLRIGVL